MRETIKPDISTDRQGAAQPERAEPAIEPPAVPDLLERAVTVRFSYPVYFTRGLFGLDNVILRETVRRLEPGRRHRLLVVLDDGVADAWPHLADLIGGYASAHQDALGLVDHVHVLPGGEIAKADSTVTERVVGLINTFGIDRQSFVVCIGGGALQDAVGYAAAIAHRGVRLIRVPTTVLSQNDSGVGVKNGINAFGKKNFIGTFAPPFAVLNDLDFIQTLANRDVIAGMSEAVKVALIRDEGFFDWIEGNAERLAAREPAPLEYLIRRCAQLHLDHIATSGDPFELGSARPLDFGHWAAHKLETMTHHRVSHGDAVGVGLALDTLYSALTGTLAQADAERVLAVLERLGLLLWDEALEAQDDAGRPTVLSGLGEFREHLGGELSVTLLSEIGRGFEAHALHQSILIDALDRLRRRHEAR